jgi:hypothetical protein
MALKLEFLPRFRRPPSVLLYSVTRASSLALRPTPSPAETGDLVTGRRRGRAPKGKRAADPRHPRPTGLEVSRLVVVGLGKVRELKARTSKARGVAMGRCRNRPRDDDHRRSCRAGGEAGRGGRSGARRAAARPYVFDRYKTKRKDDEQPASKVTCGLRSLAWLRRPRRSLPPQCDCHRGRCSRSVNEPPTCCIRTLSRVAPTRSRNSVLPSKFLTCRQ